MMEYNTLEYNMLVADFRAVVAELERERGYHIGGFALDETTGRWKVIRPDGKFELLDTKQKEQAK